MSFRRFTKISEKFLVEGTHYGGMVIASPDSLYLIMVHVGNGAANGAAMGGLVGGLIGGAISAYRSSGVQKRSTGTVGQIDREILNDVQWPYPRHPKKEAKQVLVIPRQVVDQIVHPSFTNILRFKAWDFPVRIDYPVFSGAQVRDYLVNTGWPVKWKGKVLTAGGV